MPISNSTKISRSTSLDLTLSPPLLLKIPSVGVKCAGTIEGWQKRAHFSEEVKCVGEMIQEDARRCLELDEKVKRLETKIAEVAKDSTIAKTLRSIPGFGPVCTSELAGEVGTIERFGSEASLSLYLGMSTLGKYQGTKAPKHVNTRAKAAMMIGVEWHRKYVPESQRYYEKKRSEGKKHKPGDSCFRSTPLSDHLQDAQGRTPIRDPLSKREYQDQGPIEIVRYNATTEAENFSEVLKSKSTRRALKIGSIRLKFPSG